MDKEGCLNWSYIAGYGDGEGCLLLGITQEKRPSKLGNSFVGGYNITPSWTLTTFDKTTLIAIRDYCMENGFKVSAFETRKQRVGQTSCAYRISILGWDNILYFLKKIEPFTIAKLEQYKLFYKLCEIKRTLPKNKFNKHIWTREKFIDCMNIVDDINKQKNRKRGLMNSQYFIKLWRLNAENSA